MQHVTVWNRKGLNWRLWTTPELLHIVHRENIEGLREHAPLKLRKYLIRMEDEEMLRLVDNESMGSGGKK